MACKEYIKSCTLTMEDVDLLWKRIQEEIEFRDTTSIDVDPKMRLLKSQVESKLKVRLCFLSVVSVGRANYVFCQVSIFIFVSSRHLFTLCSIV